MPHHLLAHFVDPLLEVFVDRSRGSRASPSAFFSAALYLPSSTSRRSVVHRLALLVHHVVVLEQVLANVEVARFDLLLRVLDRSRDPRMLDRHVFFHAERVHDALHAFAREDPHQVVFEREKEPRAARIALAPRAPAQLIVDASRLVSFGADDVQPASFDDARRVRRRTRSLCFATSASNSSFHRRVVRVLPACLNSIFASISGLPPRRMSVPRPAMFVATVTALFRPGLRDDVRLAFVVLRVQHFVRDARASCSSALIASLFATLTVPTRRRLPALDAVRDLLAPPP